jgi:hypothetical protein
MRSELTFDPDGFLAAEFGGISVLLNVLGEAQVFVGDPSRKDCRQTGRFLRKAGATFLPFVECDRGIIVATALI